MDALEVRGEVGLRERLDAVVVRLRATHHALAPPVLDHALGRRRAGPVVPIEGSAGKVDVELCATAGKRLAETVEDFDRKTARIGGRPQHDWRYRADQHELDNPLALLAILGDVSSRFATARRVADVNRVAKV